MNSQSTRICLSTKAEKLLTYTEACAFLGVERHSFQRFLHRDARPLPHLRVGCQYRFKREDLEAWGRENARDRSAKKLKAKRPARRGSLSF